LLRARRLNLLDGSARKSSRKICPAYKAHIMQHLTEGVFKVYLVRNAE